MRIVSTSVTALAAIGFIAGAPIAASACEWHAMNVTAAATPAPTKEDVAAPATNVDRVKLAELGKAAIVPQKPEQVLETEAE